MIKLRDGSEAQDIRFGRLSQFDKRSRSFPIRQVVEGKPLRSYTWRISNCFDQGSEGACVAFAFGHELSSRPAEVKGVTEDWLVRGVYWNAQKIDPWLGGSYPAAEPVYEGTSVLAGAKILRDLGAFKEYRWAFTFQDFLLGLAYNGPAVIGIPWYEGMFEPRSSGFIYPEGRVLGGHAVLVRAIDLREERLTIRNSWGDNWGMKGDCYITFEDMETLLEQQGEALFPVHRTRKFNNFRY